MPSCPNSWETESSPPVVRQTPSKDTRLQPVPQGIGWGWQWATSLHTFLRLCVFKLRTYCPFSKLRKSPKQREASGEGTLVGSVHHCEARARQPTPNYRRPTSTGPALPTGVPGPETRKEVCRPREDETWQLPQRGCWWDPGPVCGELKALGQRWLPALSRCKMCTFREGFCVLVFHFF